VTRVLRLLCLLVFLVGCGSKHEIPSGFSLPLFPNAEIVDSSSDAEEGYTWRSIELTADLTRANEARTFYLEALRKLDPDVDFNYFGGSGLGPELAQVAVGQKDQPGFQLYTVSLWAREKELEIRLMQATCVTSGCIISPSRD
jgi:hypothetical protein